jgi:hypothetical protein
VAFGILICILRNFFCFTMNPLETICEVVWFFTNSCGLQQPPTRLYINCWERFLICIFFCNDVVTK